MSQGNYSDDGVYWGLRHSDDNPADPRWVAADREIAELKQQLSNMRTEREEVRKEVAAEIQSAATFSVAINERLQRFSAEITPDMDGAAIKQLAKKHGL